MAKAIQLLNQTKKGFEINTKEVFKILDEIADFKIAVVSINGNKRTGKSFILNYFLRYLYAQKANTENWISSNEDSFSGFEWRGGSDRHTVGIWMWSEPFIMKSKSGDKTAILLLDTQGNFDEKTTFQECGVIFSLSALMSSTLILNMKNEISEDKLQFVEFFTFFAESFSGGTNSDYLFQRLIFLIRDWENPDSHQFGCHDDVTPEIKNYKRKMIDPNDDQCKEAQNTRSQILSYFKHVSSFLMPHPGKKVTMSSFKGQSNLIDDDFLEMVEKFVPLVLSSNIEPKKMGGFFVTGASLKQYITKWAEIIRTQKIPEAKSLSAAIADVNYLLALNHACNMYETKMRKRVESKPTELELYDIDKKAEAESLQYFHTESRGNISEEKKTELFNELLKQINQIYEVLKVINNARIQREACEGKLNAAIEKQQKLEMQMTNQKNEALRKQEELKNEMRIFSIAFEEEKQRMHYKLKSIQIKMELEFKIWRLEAERQKQISNMQRNYLKDKFVAVRMARNEARKKMDMFREQSNLPPENCSIL